VNRQRVVLRTAFKSITLAHELTSLSKRGRGEDWMQEKITFLVFVFILLILKLKKGALCSFLFELIV